MKKEDKSLKSSAINIKGKLYVQVADRIVYFNEKYPNGAIQTEMVSNINDENIIVKAIVTPDMDSPTRTFTGYSQTVKGDGYINKTSALENAETSAVGRALAMMGIGIIEAVASVDEINKAQNAAKEESKVTKMINNVPYTYKEGLKDGKKWAGWMPPKDRTDLKPEWVKLEDKSDKVAGSLKDRIAALKKLIDGCKTSQALDQLTPVLERAKEQLPEKDYTEIDLYFMDKGIQLQGGVE